MIGILNKNNFWLQNVDSKDINLFDTDTYNIGIAYNNNLEFYKPKLVDDIYIEGATLEEIEVIEDSKYPCNVTALQFELELIYSDLTTAIDNAVESLDEPTKTIVKLKRSKATEFDRKDQFIQQLGQAAGMTKQDINEFFLRASKR